MHFQFLYELNGELIRKQDLPNTVVERIVMGKRIEIPNWGVRIPSNKYPLLPDLTLDGKLVQDYLIISSLPNVLNRASLDAGHRIINFGGTHREGTQAVEQLFTNEEILRDLTARVAKKKKNDAHEPYWQALVLVNCDPNNNTVSLSHVIDLLEVEVQPRALNKLTDINHKDLMRYKPKHGSSMF
jgi:hypothetical protein